MSCKTHSQVGYYHAHHYALEFPFLVYNKNIIALTTLCGYSHDMLFKQGTEYINPSELFDA